MFWLPWDQVLITMRKQSHSLDVSHFTFVQIYLKVIRNHIIRLGPKIWLNASLEFKLQLEFQFRVDVLSHCAALPKSIVANWVIVFFHFFIFEMGTNVSQYRPSIPVLVLTYLGQKYKSTVVLRSSQSKYFSKVSFLKIAKNSSERIFMVETKADFLLKIF